MRKAKPAERYFNAAAQLLREGKPEEAEKQYRRALMAAPKSAEVHYNLGNALLVQGKVEQAIESYHKALRLKPTHSLARAQKLF